jgi:hypothetical protein
LFFSQDFLDAKQAVSFFAFILGKLETGIVQSVSLTNDKTKEQLMIKANDTNPDPDDPCPRYFVTISRYPMGAKEQCIKEVWKIVGDALWIHRQERKIQVDLN